MVLYIIKYGLILSAILSLVIFVSLKINPRLWLQGAPQKIKDAVPPISESEKRQTLIFKILFFLLVLILPILAGMEVKAKTGAELGLVNSFIIPYGVLFVFNLVDLIIIDWLIICAITPKFILIPGTEHLISEYKNYTLHLKGFFKGIFILLVPSLFIAILLQLILEM